MFISCRRFFLDQFLDTYYEDFSGTILDIGGKSNNKRGVFSPPVSENVKWIYLNIDPSTKPDLLSSAESIPLESGVVDWFLLIEVLEHVDDPVKVLQEAYRILKNSGRGLVTIPFLYPVHADPDDYRRWTKDQLMRVLTSIGFNIVSIRPMGGIFSVILDLLRYKVACRADILSRVVYRIIREVSKFVTKHERSNSKITSGWEVEVFK